MSTITLTSEQYSTLLKNQAVSVIIDGVLINVVPTYVCKEDVLEYQAALRQVNDMLTRGDIESRWVSMSRASVLTEASAANIAVWRKKRYISGRRETTGRRPWLVDLVDVLYCQAIHKARGSRGGAELLKADGTPKPFAKDILRALQSA